MSWPTVKISEVAEINPKLRKGIDEAQDITFLPMAAISENGKVIGGEIRKLKDVKKGFTYFERKDILIAKITPCFENGKAAILKDLPTPIGFGSTEFHVIRPIVSKVDPEYLFTMLWNTYFRTIGAANMTGSAGQKRLPVKFIQEFSIPLPPLALQKEISERILKSRQLIQQSIEMEYQLNALAQAVFLEMFGDPVSNPYKWPQISVRSFSSVITGNTPSRANEKYYNSKFIEWIKSDNINTPSSYLTEAKEYLSESGRKVGRVAEKGSVLVTCIAGSLSCIGNSAIANRTVSFNQQINAIIPKSDVVTTEFIYMLFVLGKKIIQDTSTNAMKGMVSKGVFEGLEFPIPPLEMQKKFSVLFKVIEENKLQVSKYTEGADRIVNSVLRLSFGNKLDLKKVA